MARKLAAVNAEEWRKFYLFDIKVEVDQHDGKAPYTGELQIDCSVTGQYDDRTVWKLPLMAVWVDRTGGKQNVCKAHASLPRRNKKQSLKHTEERILGFAQYVRYRRSWKKHGRPDMVLTVDDRYHILRYAAEDLPYSSISSEDGYTSIPIFDNKALALHELFTVIRRYSSTRLSGMDLINLNQVSDDVLQQIGFTKVPDELGSGVPMWQGDPERIASLGKSGHSSYSRWGGGTAVASAGTQEVIDSFLEILESELV